MRREDILALLRIQKADQEIEFLERRLSRIRRERKELEDKRKSLLREEEELLEQESELERKLRQLRETLSHEEALLERTEQKMLTVKRDYEYRALLREKAHHEDSVLKLLYQIEDLERRISDIREIKKQRIPGIKGRRLRWLWNEGSRCAFFPLD